MLNVRFVCCLMNMFVVSTWLQNRVLADKQGVHFPVLEGILNFLTLPFSIRVPPITSFRFLFPLKAVIGCSWNNIYTCVYIYLYIYVFIHIYIYHI